MRGIPPPQAAPARAFFHPTTIENPARIPIHGPVRVGKVGGEHRTACR